MTTTILWLWSEWSGAIGRWRRGESLRASDHNFKIWSAQYRENEERKKARKSELRRAYEADNSLALSIAFQREFRLLKIYEDDIRSEVLKKYGNTCAACRRVIKRQSHFHVDHIKPRKYYPELAYLVSNLQLLCAKCNRHKHAYDGDDWREVTALRRKQATARKTRKRLAPKDE